MWGERSNSSEGFDSHELTDASLCELVRGGSAWPLGVLWSRHHELALAWARKKDSSAAEDVVAESFDLVFQALLDGGGPTDSFKAYLFRTMNAQFGRHWTRQQRNSTIDEIDFEDRNLLLPDERTDADEQRLAAAEAFRTLPERWQQIIFAVDVEGRPVQEVADNLELTPNSTSALLKRARDGLRKSWLGIMHPVRDLPEECAQSVSRFSDLRWGKKNTQRRLDAKAHVDDCDRCRSRWVLFIEQAGVIGLVSTGILALTKDWRKRIAVPTLAVVSTASLSLAVATSIVPLFAPELALPGMPPRDAQVSSPAGPNTPLDEQRLSPSGDGTVSHPTSRASAAASSQADGTGTRGPDGTVSTGAASASEGTSAASAGSRANSASASDADAASDPSSASNSNNASDANSTSSSNSGSGSNASSSTSSGAASDGAANGGPGMLYYGNWADWCDSTQSFTEAC